MAPVADKTLAAKKAAENTIFFMMHSFGERETSVRKPAMDWTT
jgi:hypothetical protein